MSYIIEKQSRQVAGVRSSRSRLGILIVVLLAFSITMLYPHKTAQAVSASDWRAGNIIDDGVFYNGGSMSTTDIQNFLNSKVPTCDTNGTRIYSGSQTRAQYGTSRGYPPPYTCLKSYTQDGLSAAQIIKNASTTYNISPKTLLVLLQKEQTLVTDDWPWSSQYRSATGYGCPDTAPCDAEYYGFANQVTKAAFQFRRYATYPSEYRYKPFQNNTIQYNPNAGCGSSTVYIQNLATAGLYNYTPYQPNASALNNLYGAGDSCGAYGNRNFWRLFNDWFGSTTGTLWRTQSDGTLYLVDGGVKYVINNIGYLEQFGYGAKDIRFVSQQELDSVPGASAPYSANLGQIVKSGSDSDADGGTVYFFDSGRKIPISSMEQLANFGFSVSDITYLPLEFIQRYNSDSPLSSFIRDPNLSIYQMENNKKRIFFELSHYNTVNPTGAFTNLSNFSFSRWQYGQPQIDGSYLITGPDGTIRLYNGANYHILTSMNTYECWGMSGLRSYRVGGYEAVNGTSSGTLRCIGKDSSNTTFLLDGLQKYQVPDVVSPSTPADDVFTRLQTKALPETVRNSSGEISVIENYIRRPLASMITYNSLNLGSSSITRLTNGAYQALDVGTIKLAPGNLILDETGTISVINTDQNRYLLPSATRFNDYNYNWGSLIRLPTSSISGYSSIGTLASIVKISGNAYIVDSGKRYLIPSNLYSSFGFQLSSLNEIGATVIENTTQQDASKFVMNKSNGTVYMLEDGNKRPISSWSVLLRESGGSPVILQLNDATMSQFALGAVVN
ncbi:hypothetical protein H6800_01185 [Candidatus Nomurabacteria bacterium]|nr:hypothetical protein [Candidatus Nomurabacteria bacterium]